MKSTCLIFDYDWSLINENSDTFIFQKALPENPNYLFDILNKKQLQWTDGIDFALHELFRLGKLNKADMQQILREIPIQENMLNAIRYAASLNHVDLFVVSDANVEFIAETLRHVEVYDLFKGIISNHAAYDENDHLRIKHYQLHRFNAPHECTKGCPVNMCKGDIVKEIISNGNYERIAYVGDGGGDLCPIVSHMKKNDLAFAREDQVDGKKFALLQKLKSTPNLPNIIHPWSTGNDINRMFRELL